MLLHYANISFVNAMGSHERRDVCHVCGNILVDGMKQRLFDSAAGRLASLLASITARPVVKGDGLPTLLCKSCHRKLERSKNWSVHAFSITKYQVLLNQSEVRTNIPILRR